MQNRLESFSRKVKTEISTEYITEEEKKSLISGFSIASGIVSLVGNNQAKLVLKTEIASCARLVFNIFKHTFNIKDSHIYYQNKSKFAKKIVYNVQCKGEIIPLIRELEIRRDLRECIPVLMTSAEYVRGFFCGLFLGCGSITEPSKDYYMEFVLDSLDMAEYLKTVLNNLYENLEDVMKYNFKIVPRRNKYVLYLKRSEMISNFIAFLRCSNAVLDFENIRIEKDFLNSENRLENCMTINYQRSLKNATENINTINEVLKVRNLSFFNEKEQAVIKERLNNPELTYNELIDAIHEKYGFIVSKSYISTFFSYLKSLID